MVAIIDYGMGNVASVQKALHYLKIDSCITNDSQLIGNADYILLPGVGSFQKGMQNLMELNLDNILTREVIQNGKPFMGICLGMQLIATVGMEPEATSGLNWIKGEVVKIEGDRRRIPHMGWNTVNILNDKFFTSIPNQNQDFYFIHSFHFKVDDQSLVSSTVEYGDILTASVQKNNIFATQFHPEKSQDQGMEVLKNFFQLHA